MTYLRIWRYLAAPGREAEFEQAYGPRGDWARLFARGEGYLGTEFVRPVAPARHYLTIDRWRSAAAWAGFLTAHRADYDELDRRLASLCAEDLEIASGDATGPAAPD